MVPFTVEEGDGADRQPGIPVLFDAPGALGQFQSDTGFCVGPLGVTQCPPGPGEQRTRLRRVFGRSGSNEKLQGVLEPSLGVFVMAEGQLKVAEVVQRQPLLVAITDLSGDSQRFLGVGGGPIQVSLVHRQHPEVDQVGGFAVAVSMCPVQAQGGLEVFRGGDTVADVLIRDAELGVCSAEIPPRRRFDGRGQRPQSGLDRGFGPAEALEDPSALGQRADSVRARVRGVVQQRDRLVTRVERVLQSSQSSEAEGPFDQCGDLAAPVTARLREGQQLVRDHQCVRMEPEHRVDLTEVEQHRHPRRGIEVDGSACDVEVAECVARSEAPGCLLSGP